jgi:undecaprenyl diphosphate synthase
MNELNHVAIIMDGNGRWGLKKKKSRNYGHLQGIKRVETVIKASVRQKIPFLTLYTFSTENWKRPENEINFLFDLIRKSLRKNLKEIIKEGVKINVIGKRKDLPNDVNRIIKIVEKKTFNNKMITLNLALNYGSKEEIINACKSLAKKKRKEINIKNFEKELYTKNIPHPDILIRKRGKRRLSNFLLWQLAYAEILFVNKLWPDFNVDDFNNILKKYNKIKRNFGKI